MVSVAMRNGTNYVMPTKPCVTLNPFYTVTCPHRWNEDCGICWKVNLEASVPRGECLLPLKQQQQQQQQHQHKHHHHHQQPQSHNNNNNNSNPSYLETQLNTAYGLNHSSEKDSVYFSNSSDLIVTTGELIYNRFRVIGPLGRGSFGQVVKCFDSLNKREYAVKILSQNKSVGAIKAEVDALQLISQLGTRDLFVQCYGSFFWRDSHCIILELLSDNLYDYLRVNTNFAGISIFDVRKIAHQLLSALDQLSSMNIVHCDIKPENIALVVKNDLSKVKLIDFGSSCHSGKTIYRYIQSRFYRAPEVILELGYDKEIDMWSVACVLVELLVGVPLFPGNSELEQLAYFTEILGKIPDDMAACSPKFSTFFIMCNRSIRMRTPDNYMYVPVPGSRPLSSIISKRFTSSRSNKPSSSYNTVGSPNSVLYFQDLIQQMLSYKASNRITPFDALKHPFFTLQASWNNQSTVSSFSNGAGMPVALMNGSNYSLNCVPVNQVFNLPPSLFLSLNPPPPGYLPYITAVSSDVAANLPGGSFNTLNSNSYANVFIPLSMLYDSSTSSSYPCSNQKSIMDRNCRLPTGGDNQNFEKFPSNSYAPAFGNQACPCCGNAHENCAKHASYFSDIYLTDLQY